MYICNWVIHKLFPGQQKNATMTAKKIPCQGEVSIHRRTTPKRRVVPNEKTVFSIAIVSLHQIVAGTIPEAEAAREIS